MFHAWRRVPNRRFKLAGDGGYDAEHNHELARQDMGQQSLIPATIGRTPGGEDRIRGRWRRHMRRLLKTKRCRRRCGYTQGWQAETANSMIKRNTGSALRARTRCGRLRDLRRKVITHNVMILRNEARDRAVMPPFPAYWTSSIIVYLAQTFTRCDQTSPRAGILRPASMWNSPWSRKVLLGSGTLNRWKVFGRIVTTSGS
ncbi:hypothetical protein [Fontivita pretiosa]|uniref:hypothetical protein n=1 Tax=Fontivita pretiosa TaxID=2989684 RepID=UPI003D163BE1